MNDSTKEARRTIANEASEIAKGLAGQFQLLAGQLGRGSVHSPRADAGEPEQGDAYFLYEHLPYNDTDLKFDDEVRKLKSFVAAIMALEKLEEGP